MKIVKQYNNYACILACLESYLADQGYAVTQIDLLNRYPQYCHMGEAIEGAFDLSPDSIAEVGRDFGFSSEFTQLFEPAPESDYFIVTLEGDKHYVRVRRYLDGDLFEVMDPNINRDNDRLEYTIFDFAHEQHRQPGFLRLTRNP